ncbi:MAG: DNA mismatch repair protein MutS, partial [Pseudomonadota bacterium]|nr:DNA mismatch repair protein MutS [Pseudomonadota bacterium]
MRTLDPEEAALWAMVTATIRPLSREPQARVAAGESKPPPPAPPARQQRLAKGPPPRAKALPAPPPVRPGTTLDGSWDRRLVKGAFEPD